MRTATTVAARYVLVNLCGKTMTEIPQPDEWENPMEKWWQENILDVLDRYES